MGEKIKKGLAYGCAFIIAVMLLAACQGAPDDDYDEDGEGKGRQEEKVEEDEAVKEKEKLYVFTGYYISEDKETIANYVIYCYADGTLILESDENKTGSWEEVEGEKITLNIDGKTYDALPDEDKSHYNFVYDAKMGELDLEIAMRCKVGDLSTYNELNRIETFREPVEQLVKKYEGTEGGIIFYGGSNFVKWTTMEQDLSEFPIYNKSFGGSSDATRSYYAPRLLYGSNPDMIVFMSSTNDWTDGNGLEEVIEIKQKFYEDTAKNLPDTAIVIMSATPNPLRYFGEYHDGMVACDEWLKAYCEEHENFYFLDCKDALSANDGTEAVAEYWIEDQLHLTPEGYEKLAQLMRTELGRICQERNLTWE